MKAKPKKLNHAERQLLKEREAFAKVLRERTAEIEDLNAKMREMEPLPEIARSTYGAWSCGRSTTRETWQDRYKFAVARRADYAARVTVLEVLLAGLSKGLADGRSAPTTLAHVIDAFVPPPPAPEKLG